jgi:hypothetical protein
MAYRITDKPNTEAPSTAYPYGNIRDKTISINGTPVNKMVYADFHQFFAKLMDFAGVTPNGLPDNEYSGWQLFESLMVALPKKYILETTSEGNGDVITILLEDIEQAFRPDFLSTPFEINTVVNEYRVCDINIDVYAYELTSTNKWDKLAFVNPGQSGNSIQITSSGNIEIKLDSFNTSPAVPIRVMIIA